MILCLKLELILFMQSSFVVYSFLSDYLVAFDLWIITPSKTGEPWLATLTTLTTAIVYGLSEPLWRWFMRSITDNTTWLVLMSTLGHIGMIFAANIAVVATWDTMPNQSNDTTNREKTPSAQHPSRPRFTTAITLLPILPAITAAGTNAAIVIHTQYLNSDDSRQWVDRAPVGWIIVASVIAFALGISKIIGTLMHQAFRRSPLLTYDFRGISQRIACLVVLLTTRALCRLSLGQAQFLTVGASVDSGRLFLKAPIHEVQWEWAGRNKSKPLDEFLGRIPPWFVKICNITSISICVGFWATQYFRRSSG